MSNFLIAADQSKSLQISQKNLTRAKVGLGQNKSDIKIRIDIAHSRYPYVTQDRVNDFTNRLEKSTEKKVDGMIHYQTLKWMPIEEYTEIPPIYAMEAVHKAQKTNIFDWFELVKPIWKQKPEEKVIDPIVFGRINSCSDRFYITQWDDDIAINDFFDL
jgi:hypothetical protein